MIQPTWCLCNTTTIPKFKVWWTPGLANTWRGQQGGVPGEGMRALQGLQTLPWQLSLPSGCSWIVSFMIKFPWVLWDALTNTEPAEVPKVPGNLEFIVKSTTGVWDGVGAILWDWVFNLWDLRLAPGRTSRWHPQRTEKEHICYPVVKYLDHRREKRGRKGVFPLSGRKCTRFVWDTFLLHQK